MEKKQFQAESKRLLDLMINSIYTHKEIFLRELISNASDAIDKLYFASLTDDKIGMKREDFEIKLETNETQRTLKISDNGCGMNAEDMENNLGIIAKSGTLDFKQKNDLGEDVDIIGQFGVGFYSAFMVSSRIVVESLKYGETQAYRWTSDGLDGYTIEPCEKTSVGTDITLYIRENTEEENYDRFTQEYGVSTLVKKYSDYIRYPIKMDFEREREVEGKEEKERYIETETLNSMIPIWKRSKSEITKEEYNAFYRNMTMDFTEPARVLHIKAEGTLTYNALLYFPAHAPSDYYTRDFRKGLALYSNGVLIMERCEDLLPDYFGFVVGLVDSSDLSLNISREMLQHDRQLKAIAQNLKLKIKNELKKMMQEDRTGYELFWMAFGLQLKYGVYQDYGQNKDFLQDLLMFYSLKEKKLITLKEYTEAMPEEQKYIYYATTVSADRVEQLPQAEAVQDKGYDILCLTESVDEFALRVMMQFDEKEFKSISDGDLGFEQSEDDEEEIKEQQEENEGLLEDVKKALDGKVEEVKLSARLKTHPVCLSAKGNISIGMERAFNAMPTNQAVHAQHVLEINANHPIFEKLKELESQPEKLKALASVLYTQALLIEGLPIDDPSEYSDAVCKLIAE